MYDKTQTENMPFKGVKVLMMAGGTGGHIFPALAVGESLCEAGAIVHWMGSKGGLEEQLVPTEKMPLHLTDIQGLRGKSFTKWLKAPVMLLKALLQVRHIFKKVKPNLCIGMGGFASGPGGLMAWLTRTPLIIHEQNAIAGLTNKCLAPLASKVLCGFPDAFGVRHTRVIVVGNPVRADIQAIPRKQEQKSVVSPLKILVLGGSRGAQALNDCIPRALACLPAEQRPKIWHQTGESGFVDTQALYNKLGVEEAIEVLAPFIKEIQKAYAWADLVVCRAGALTIAEIASVGIPSILVPYPLAVDDHQTANAEFLVKLGAAQCVQQTALTPNGLAQQWARFSAKPQELIEMRIAASQIPLNKATAHIVQQCRAVLAC
ncbi:MAG: UDP-N-acetylglucosamine--N-acetylmuramyl-(pentapeptide) pyrophosphoryl-undecaprenol [Pseudomonadota bacterium]|jgi:UDP-N-acetylglucosamine--N-acetylmuramyl-(pentapeptide) pyrophosphoryl-undecaprenol N-acetylglucosamine transferase